MIPMPMTLRDGKASALLPKATPTMTNDESNIGDVEQDVNTDNGGLKLRSELLDYRRVTLSDWQAASEAVHKNCEEEILTTLGNQHRAELLDGAKIPEDCPKGTAGGRYFEDDRRGIEFILEALEDPTWETLQFAASMNCGGFYDQDVFEKVISEAEGDFKGGQDV